MPVDAPSTNTGKIRDSNKIMLLSAVEDLNIPFAIDGGTAKDEYVYLSFEFKFYTKILFLKAKLQLFKHYNQLLS